MNICFNGMSDDRYWNQEPVLLLINGRVHEATFENSRGWFYLYNRWDGEENDELPEFLMEDDERLEGWCFAKIDEN